MHNARMEQRTSCSQVFLVPQTDHISMSANADELQHTSSDPVSYVLYCPSPLARRTLHLLTCLPNVVLVLTVVISAQLHLQPCYFIPPLSPAEQWF
jgi:tetrahydromethanopterin S-methyltransferase subunit E